MWVGLVSVPRSQCDVPAYRFAEQPPLHPRPIFHAEPLLEQSSLCSETQSTFPHVFSTWFSTSNLRMNEFPVALLSNKGKGEAKTFRDQHRGLEDTNKKNTRANMSSASENYFAIKANVVSTSSLPQDAPFRLENFCSIRTRFFFEESSQPSMIMIKIEKTGIVSIFEILEHNHPLKTSHGERNAMTMCAIHTKLVIHNWFDSNVQCI
ncbi:hypothetical protein CDAR_525781 [Caerostris darwini]|uniref:Uncharacterized protein n=1 Tax=Caerostris darwini TaxID=1538125 RepID=A0AAV4V6H2_9ARAC|nr:hypothetical protein CDAR_525781 [Caerostris darwini]